MDTIDKNSGSIGGGSPWTNPEGTFPTKEEMLKEQARQRNEERMKDPMAKFGQMIMSVVLEKSKGWLKEFADFAGHLMVGVVPDPDNIPTWPGFVPEAQKEAAE